MLILDDEKTKVIGRYNEIAFEDLASNRVVDRVTDVIGKVTSLRWSSDRKKIVVASGVAGVGGQISIVDIDTRKIVKQIEGHRDTLYSAVLSPMARWLQAPDTIVEFRFGTSNLEILFVTSMVIMVLSMILILIIPVNYLSAAPLTKRPKCGKSLPACDWIRLAKGSRTVFRSIHPRRNESDCGGSRSPRSRLETGLEGT